MQTKTVNNLNEKGELPFLEKVLELTGVAAFRWKPGEERLFCTDRIFKILKIEKKDRNFISLKELKQFLPAETFSLIEIFASESIEEKLELNFNWTDSRGASIPACGVFEKISQGPLQGTIVGAFQNNAFERNTRKALEELNEDLNVKSKELERLNTELASFSYVASHDLQEPLRKIQAFASLILVKDANNLSESSQEHFKRIQKSAERMQEMLDGLLLLSRANTAEKTFETIGLDLALKKALNGLWEKIQKSRAVIETGKMLSARIIPLQMEQLLAQLIGNAIKFQKPGNIPHVKISCSVLPGYAITGEVVQRNKNYICISVADNGIGFDREHADRIFQLFNRLNGKTEFSGVGTGLAICRRIAQNHNGFISADSHPGQGAVFKVYLPEDGKG